MFQGFDSITAQTGIQRVFEVNVLKLKIYKVENLLKMLDCRVIQHPIGEAQKRYIVFADGARLSVGLK